MKHYHYIGHREQGGNVQGWLLAADREDALMQLRARAIQPFQIRPGPGHIPLKVPPTELLVTLRELASLRRSGMSIDDAVKAVAETTEHVRLKESWDQVRQMIRSGSSFSDAVGALPGTFPVYSRSLVALGEANGRLAEAIGIVADRLDEELRLQDEVKSSLTYPAFLLIASVSVVLFLFVAVVPRFGSMIDSAATAPTSLVVLLSISSSLRDFAWLWVTIAIAVIAGLLWGWRSGRAQALLWRWFLRVPGIAGIVESWEIVQFCGSMSRLLAGGVGVLDCLRLTGESLGREAIRDRLKKSAELVRQGDALGEALAKNGAFPALVTQMIGVGERAAHLPESMSEIADLYERRMNDRVTRLLSVFEPLVIAVMGFVVGGIMITLLSAIVTVNDIPV